MVKKKTRRTRVRKGVSKSWGRQTDVRVEYTPANIAIPAGRCPVGLEGYDLQSVREWVVALTDEKPDAYTYQPTVYKYWARHFYDFASPEFKAVQENLEKIVKGDIKTIADLEDEMPSVLSS